MFKQYFRETLRHVAAVEDIVLSHGLHPMFYADDSQIYLTMGLSNRSASIGKIEDCIQATLLVGTPITSCFATQPRPKFSFFL